MKKPAETDPRVFAVWAEAPLAYVCGALALTTLVWKTVGLEFVPGWEEMFGGVGAQYPRRVPLSSGWAIAYLLVYGVLGTAATLASIWITRHRSDLTSPVSPSVLRCARLHGFFHVVLGVHHTAWAISGGHWGHLTLSQFDVPGIYALGAVSALGAGWHGVRLLRTRPTTCTAQVVRSKIAVDGVSLLTFTSVFICFGMNLLGLERDPAVERWSWALVFIAPVLWLLADLIVSRSAALGKRAG